VKLRAGGEAGQAERIKEGIGQGLADRWVAATLFCHVAAL
jgi:hypothetical protein